MLRVKVELVPHGVEERAEVLDTILIANDGTGVCGGPDEGGVGNYEVFDNETIPHLHVVDYPSMYACGFVRGVTRDAGHRLLLAETAIGVVRQAREENWHERGKGYERPVREPEKEAEPEIPPDFLNMP